MTEAVTVPIPDQSPRDDLAIQQADLGTPLTLKEGPLFLLTDHAGDIPPQAGQGKGRGLGLYFRDMRHLDEATLRLNGAPLTSLLASTDLGYRGIRELTNPELAQANGMIVPKGTIGVHAETTLHGGGVHEVITVRNFGHESVDLVLTLTYDAQFDDMFTVRGVHAGRRGTHHPPQVDPAGLHFRYDGADRHRRTTTVAITPPPARFEDRRAIFPLRLARGAARSYTVAIAVADDPPGTTHPADLAQRTPVGRLAHRPLTAADWDWLGGGVQIVTSNELFNRVLRRSFLDLGMLAMQQGADRFFAAGVPWYVALFGRDSLITALQTLAYAPGIARTTLDLLARYQGQRDDPYRDEQPGKILHELRVGEMANLREIPFTPYYGTIDATPLFLILLGEYLRWTGDHAYFATLRPQVEAALGWLDREADSGDGFLAYAQQAERGLANQGWKDAYNSIVDADGGLANPPVALVEVQGYAYRARRVMAVAYRQAGDTARADDLEFQAAQLYQRFNERFWLPELGNYALALHGTEQRPAAVDASNQGQALWGGIVAPAHAEAVHNALLDPARLWAGWGIRTLSHAAVAYNPFDYQSGAVWPHDNALIGAGLRDYGYDAAALQILTGLYEAATRFEDYRLPELFAGFSRDEYGTPVRYPVACSPQAWSAGSLPYLLQAILGIAPDAFERRLHVVRPSLPDWLDWVTVHGVRVGNGRADLRYERFSSATMATVLRKDGDLRVTIEY